MNIFDQYIYPKLIVYLLHTIPTDLLESQFLEKVDMLIRQSIGEIYESILLCPECVTHAGNTEA